MLAAALGGATPGPGEPHEPAGSDAVHEPVLRDRVTALLATPDPGLVIDATVGAGGHARALLEASHPETTLLGIDRDADALAVADARLADWGERVALVHGAFDEVLSDLEAVVADPGPVRAILLDLGVSSLQLDTPERGFSLRFDAPLDLRMDPSQGEPARALLERLDEPELTALLRDLGEERHARRIARALVRARPITTTGALAEVVAGAVPTPARHGPRHPATRTFQALRLAVNGELERVRAALPPALARLAAPDPAGGRGGRLAVLAYHSLEDRPVKRALATAAQGCVCPPDLPVCGCGRTPTVRLLTRGAERPDDAEVARNPRARSARLRAAERLPDTSSSDVASRAGAPQPPPPPTA